MAEALDWILQPARLSWQPEGKGIVAGSDRRRGDAGWTYDVSAIALPLEEDLKKLGDEAKMLAEAQKAADEFIAALRKELKVDEASLVWFAPGQLLLFGTPAQHAALAGQIAALEAGTAKPAAGLAALERDDAQAVCRPQGASSPRPRPPSGSSTWPLAHDQFSWQLLSAAAGGKLDLEALTELQIAWQVAANGGAARRRGPRPLVLRSLWTVCEASRALPAEKELAALATALAKKSAAAIAAALTEAGANKGNLPIMASAIYAALANPADGAYRAKLLTLLSAGETDEATKELRLLGRVLLGSEITAADRAALAELVTSGVGGGEPVVLVALACRKAGESTWEQFRAESRDLLGEQPLPGEVVVLVNRLPRLP